MPGEPLALVLRPGEEAPPAAVVRVAARALVGAGRTVPQPPPWLTPHQVPAARRLFVTLERHGGALLADATGLGKSYVALAVALMRREPFALVVPAVLVDQWRDLLARYDATAPIITHESLSAKGYRPLPPPTAPYRLFIVDEAHRFRNHATRRYRTLARLVVGARVLLVTATPVHNRLADLFRLFHLFLRDDALTALGVPSLCAAARGENTEGSLGGIVARLAVARSRDRVQSGYGEESPRLTFPERAGGLVVRVGPLPDGDLADLARDISTLGARAPAAPLIRLMLLTRLASSAAAFTESLDRYAAYLELARDAECLGRTLGRRDFRRIFPDAGADAMQLALLPLLLEANGAAARGPPDDLVLVKALRERARQADDPKARLLESLLSEREGKTIVFAGARATVRHLARRLAWRRAVAVLGDGGLLGTTPATRREVLAAFAPVSQGTSTPPAALATDLLIATDLVSEGLNLQDAVRVVHYDLPWSPARLAQRVGRIDRLGSPHPTVETITFLPPPPLAHALRLEQRLLAKARLQVTTGAQVETVQGPGDAAGFDWCDRLDRLAQVPAPPASSGAWASVAGPERCVVLVVRFGASIDAIVVDETGARADPDRAARLFEDAARARPQSGERSVLERAILVAAPTLRGRLRGLADARWRSADRDRLGRRLVPWVLTAGRAAARRGDRRRLARLDALVSRLVSGMTAGEEGLLEDLVSRTARLDVRDLLAWHEGLSPLEPEAPGPRAELVAALEINARR